MTVRCCWRPIPVPAIAVIVPVKFNVRFFPPEVNFKLLLSTVAVTPAANESLSSVVKSAIVAVISLLSKVKMKVSGAFLIRKESQVKKNE